MIEVDVQTYDWGRFDITFFYPVGVRRAFDAWTTAAGLQSFFIESAVFESDSGERRAPGERVRVGDKYEWTWRHEATVAGRVLSVADDRSVSFTFGSMVCVVTFDAESEASTRVHLEQHDIADDADGQVMGHLNCRSCWIFFMTNLKSVFMTGVDLRDDDPGRVSSMEVGYGHD